MSSCTVPLDRRHDLDWLRVFAILALVFFHAGRPYVAEWTWHIRNAETSSLLLEVSFLLSRFRMALLFVIAGIATHVMLQRRSIASYLRDRARRLLVPLVFGVFVIVPPQIYFERVANGDFAGSFLTFWPRTLALRPYPGGDTSYHHLWFIAYLFLYSALLAPIAGMARTSRGAAALTRLRGWVSRHSVHLLAAPIAIAFALLVPRFRGVQNIVDDVGMFTVYFLYFVSGWIIATDTCIWRRIADGRRHAFTAAIVFLVVIDGLRWNDAEPGRTDGVARLAYLLLLALHGWAWVMTILGYAFRWLNRDHAILRWGRDASYPVYILHQTVIVVVAFYVVQASESVLAKFAFTSVVSLLLTLALYETLVRPFGAARRLFGMAPARVR